MSRFRPAARMPEAMVASAEVVGLDAYLAQKTRLGIDSDSAPSAEASADEASQLDSPAASADFYKAMQVFESRQQGTISAVAAAGDLKAKGRAIHGQLAALAAVFETNIAVHMAHAEVNSLPPNPTYKLLSRDITKKADKQTTRIGSQLAKVERSLLSALVRLRRVQRTLVARSPDLLAVAKAADSSDFLGFAPGDERAPEARRARHASWAARGNDCDLWREVDALPTRVTVWCARALDTAKVEKEVLVQQASFKALNQSYRQQIRQAVLENYDRFVLCRARPTTASVLAAKLVVPWDNHTDSSFKDEVYTDEAFYVQLLKDSVSGLSSMKRSFRAVEELKRLNQKSRSAKKDSGRRNHKNRKKMLPTEPIEKLDSFIVPRPPSDPLEDSVAEALLTSLLA